MYIATNITTNQSSLFIDKTALAAFIGVTTKTILRKVTETPTKIGSYMVSKAIFVQEKSNRGRKKGWNL